ncbi:hypothetical protein SNK03_003879 [Fusarium graminearum]|uniref:RNA helicase n=1 Tax=Gibberella zeae (strain ATCC MYA-4620 / CBS 123657 / FGSC 9075 / NRRL 31084 / PH-1) TaxID=229533 RepID=I1SA83_GIBZE|nr:hypothetical protein FGSG_13764 [Fusarium graminearum PH-1]ESU17195.1 hypothetical protein FGSG_13764 [Fusarium graminearum PH-1]CEF75900.1 unnamed protein product [Fusarium graminearum]|eukprot:XP_011319457.1 hypothetical protein FGSG_13764 [Fusarium graminearum PH-1]
MLKAQKKNPLKSDSTRSADYFRILQKRQDLPAMHRHVLDRLVHCLSKSQVLILTADTGTGKTTQITQRVHYLFRHWGQQIVCTQPRRLAARNVADRVALELDIKLGEEVGIQHRNLSLVSKKTTLKFVTEGILLRQRQNDSILRDYSCVIMDFWLGEYSGDCHPYWAHPSHT